MTAVLKNMAVFLFTKRTNKMKTMSKRQYQVGELIKRTLSSMFREGVFDEKINDLFSITEVSPSPGYQTAWVFVSAMDATKNDDLVKKLNEISSEIRYELANKINMRFTPALIFKFDNSLEYAKRIEDLLNSPEVKKDLEEN